MGWIGAALSGRSLAPKVGGSIPNEITNFASICAQFTKQSYHNLAKFIFALNKKGKT